MADSNLVLKIPNGETGEAENVIITSEPCIIEVTGTAGNIEIGKIRQLSEWYEREMIMRWDLTQQLARAKIGVRLPSLKGLLISNWQNKLPIDQ
jgi:hypothetical protein